MPRHRPSLQAAFAGRTSPTAVAVLLASSLLPFWLSTSSGAQTASAPPEASMIYRFDPIHNKLVPIEAKQLKPGCVYSHFSHRLGRRVWSYVQKDGTFWNALGEGTTIEGRRLDVRGERGQILGELTEVNPELARRVQQGVRPLRYTLNARQQWIESGTSRVLSFYDVETGHRWEKLGRQFIPVASLTGFRWQIRGGVYVPESAAAAVWSPDCN